MDKLMIALIIISSIVLIASILLQPGKSAGLSGSIAGGAESLFGKKKAKGYEAMLEKATTVSAVVFMLSAFLFSLIK
ncbi:MAG TPA: preprotein translocase subunit SecG [Eubacteriaceae bacterium]|jgi:preprotein translocase subunit SecG|nr:preprotein translocase subunit SecG [Eubacteriaceae bacterium]